jgi:hypothetical protein
VRFHARDAPGKLNCGTLNLRVPRSRFDTGVFDTAVFAVLDSGHSASSPRGPRSISYQRAAVWNDAPTHSCDLVFIA